MNAPARWIFPPDFDSFGISYLADELALPRPVAEILWRRGYQDTEAARKFINPTLDDLFDPFLLEDMHLAIARIREAIANREPIEIHGDYDVDGVTSTVILLKALELAGSQAPTWRIPDRRDGYGMQADSMEDAAARGVKLIISVDNGIRAGEAVEKAEELGLDVIVTDHHLPETDLPPALAIINPNRLDCAYPNKDLCGAGVAFKLAHALLSRCGWPDAKLRRIVESFLKLAAIGTVADIVPLTGENRIIVKHGLEGLADVRNPGLKAMLKAAGFSNGRIPNATEVAFRIAPAINASGRMALASRAVEMFLTDDQALADEIAGELFALNAERQTAERAIVKEIFEKCAAVPVTEDERALVFAAEGWHAGVVGIVASRVVERFHRPAIVLSIENGIAKGSARSIHQFHLLDALESMGDLFTRFGGHAHAAGMTLPEANVEALRERLHAYAYNVLQPEDLCGTVEIDAVVDFTELDDRLWAALEKLAPFGMKNRRPLFAIRNAELNGPPQVWKEKHLRLAVRQSGRTLVMKAWGQADQAGELSAMGNVDIAFEIGRDWNNNWDLIEKHCRPSVTPDSERPALQSAPLPGRDSSAL